MAVGGAPQIVVMHQNRDVIGAQLNVNFNPGNPCLMCGGQASKGIFRGDGGGPVFVRVRRAGQGSCRLTEAVPVGARFRHDAAGVAGDEG